MDRRSPLCAVIVARCGDVRFALEARFVRAVLPAPIPVAVPDAPATLAGLIVVHGSPIPVLDLAARGAGRTASLADRIVVLDAPPRAWGLLCDAVEPVIAVPELEAADLEAVAPGVAFAAAGVVGDEAVMILADPARFLTEAEHGVLAAALAQHAAGSMAAGGPP